MFKLEKIDRMNNEKRLEYLLLLVNRLLSAEEDPIANLSNASALINAVLDRLNWVGFYLIKGVSWYSGLSGGFLHVPG